MKEIFKSDNNDGIVNSDRRAIMKKTAIAAVVFSVAWSVSGVAEAGKERVTNMETRPFVLSF